MRQASPRGMLNSWRSLSLCSRGAQRVLRYAIAYGAAPNMLVFAPDGGAGFDLMGQDSFDQILISWNTTIAGPLGTSGAQNVNPPVPKCPMAVRATPWGRNGGGFEIFHRRLLHCCNNSTSGTRTATEVTDAWVKHENCATDYGLNNGQEGEKKGSWRWGVLPMIVVVTHLGDLPTMRRWFGGSGYGIPINRYLWASFLLLICLPTTAAVTCRTCFDQNRASCYRDTQSARAYSADHREHS